MDDVVAELSTPLPDAALQTQTSLVANNTAKSQ